MNLVSVPVALMASVCLYVGIYYLWMFIRRKTEKENLTFAGLSISIALYDIFCVGLYNAGSISEGMFWQRFQFASLALFCISFVWFIFYITKYSSKKGFIILSVMLGILFILGLSLRNELTLSLDNPMVKKVELGSIIAVTYHEVDPGIIYLLQYATMMAGFIWLLVILIKDYRAGNRKIRPILISLIVFFFAAANDVLVGAAVYPFVYLLEYVYMIIILSMAYVLLNKFVDLHHEVEELNVNLELKVEQRTEELQAAMEELKASNEALVDTRDALWGEMQLAKKIQTVLLPVKPVIKGFEITAFMEPASEVGGDYYDIINVADRDWMVVGDVSGHGVSAGLVMMMVQTSIRVAIDQNPRVHPSELLALINRTISYNIKQFGEDKYMTITVFAAMEKGKFYFSGLHQDIMIYRAKGGDIELVETRGMWIGLVDSIEGMVEDDSLMLHPGDIMLIYTDGITEAWKKGSIRDERDPENQMFGNERLMNILREYGSKSPAEIKSAIINALINYDCSDDVTMVIIKRTE